MLSTKNAFFLVAIASLLACGKSGGGGGSPATAYCKVVSSTQLPALGAAISTLETRGGEIKRLRAADEETRKKDLYFHVELPCIRIQTELGTAGGTVRALERIGTTLETELSDTGWRIAPAGVNDFSRVETGCLMPDHRLDEMQSKSDSALKTLTEFRDAFEAAKATVVAKCKEAGALK